MTTFLFVRHGQANYKPIDDRKFIGHGRALAPLTDLGIHQLKTTSTDTRFTGSEIIISSPYTRALQSAAILSKALNLDIHVEVDLHEWIPDCVNYQYKTSQDCIDLAIDFDKHNGIHPVGKDKVWETTDSMKKRLDGVLNRYKTYNKVIVVCHGMIIRTLHDKEHIKNGEIIKVDL